MPRTYLEEAALLTDPDFRDRVQMAILDYAHGTVYAEGAGAANHAERKALADLVVLDPIKYGDLFALNLASINTLEVTDLGIRGALGTYLDGYWNRLAGVTV